MATLAAMAFRAAEARKRLTAAAQAMENHRPGMEPLPPIRKTKDAQMNTILEYERLAAMLEKMHAYDTRTTGVVPGGNGNG